MDDRTAEKFAKYMKKYPNLYEYLAKIVQKHIPSSKPMIIDLGAGPGLLSLEIHKKIPDANIISIDPSPKMLQLAHENARKVGFETFKTMRGASEKIPLKDNFADIIVIRFSLPYWKQPKDSFVEMFRVLKPNGKVILETLNKDFSKFRLFLIKLHMLLNSAGGDVTKYHIDTYKSAYTIDQVVRFLTDAKFTIIEKEGKKEDWKFIVVAEKK